MPRLGLRCDTARCVAMCVDRYADGCVDRCVDRCIDRCMDSSWSAVHRERVLGVPEPHTGGLYLKDCYIERPHSLLAPYQTVFNLRLYFMVTWMTQRGALNLTFPNPDWRSLKFQYQGKEPEQRLCRVFSLHNVTVPVLDTLMWDCPTFTDPGFSGNDFELSFITDEGVGGSFSFKVPHKQHISGGTELKDWHVFFYLHKEHVVRTPFLPVTVQAAPFHGVSYNVSLVRCQDRECQHYARLVSHLVTPPTMYDGDGLPAVWTELLPSWSTPAVYAVTVQLVSPHCPPQGCAHSMSPTFEIKENQLGFWLGIFLVFVLLFVVTFFVTHHHRSKGNKRRLEVLKENPPGVLLVYLPENNACLEMVKTFAEVLKDFCYVTPYVVDNDVGTKNPNLWTCEHMNKASRLLILVPGNVNGESTTPIRDQWRYGLHYLSGPYFLTHHVQTKGATVLLPYSSTVPYQIASTKRFSLPRDLVSLVTWIHHGSWIDKKLLWGPIIENARKTSHSIRALENVIKKATDCTKCYKQDVYQPYIIENYSDVIVPVGGHTDQNVHPLCSGPYCNGGLDMKCTDTNGAVCVKTDSGRTTLRSNSRSSSRGEDEDPYDPNIQCVEALLGSSQDVSVQPSDTDSDALDEDAFL